MLCRLVEIRPKWDWKPTSIKYSNEARVSWNQTKMGLKVCFIFKNIVNPTAKSWNQTKMGLKDVHRCVIPPLPYGVEIRPKWDWKSIAKNWKASVSTLLKSDQNGIERKWFALQGDFYRVSWNQTKMGLKGSRCTFPYSSVCTVEIRPKWDWKVTDRVSLQVLDC